MNKTFLQDTPDPKNTMSQQSSLPRFQNLTLAGRIILFGAVVLVPSWLHAQIAIQNGGTQTITGGGNTIDGGGQSGFFVQSGALTISDTTLQNFHTTGGNGSGGGAGMGGAVFVNTGATLTLHNVTFLTNTAQGGNGGNGSVGGSLNNLFNSNTPVASADGTTPEQFTLTDIGGTTGTTGVRGVNNSSGSAALAAMVGRWRRRHQKCSPDFGGDLLELESGRDGRGSHRERRRPL